MPAQPLTELSLDTLHAARQACLTLLIDQHRIYLDSGPAVLRMLAKLRDDVGDRLGMEPLGKATPVEQRGIGEATDPELKSLERAVSTLLDRCRAAIDDPALAEYLTGLRASIGRERAERKAVRAGFAPQAS
ncbi:MAG TPA: hypothetical protein VMU95_28830 [Trebonia sp.]|nr:hypothetical protein [Trebonia sp.]